jgi:hypothetical protein
MSFVLRKFEKDSIAPNCPSQQTIMSINHGIMYLGKLRKAFSFVNQETIRFVPYHGELMYNILLPVHYTMNVNGLTCEMLHPQHHIATFYSVLSEFPSHEHPNVYPILYSMFTTQYEKQKDHNTLYVVV